VLMWSNTALSIRKKLMEPEEILSPVMESSLSVSPEIEENEEYDFVGQASYYWTGGCVGCREDRMMANGEFLCDRMYTVAFNQAPLNSWVKITNLENGKETYARVTDTGGFEELGRIIDLTLTVKNALGCEDLCEVGVNTL